MVVGWQGKWFSDFSDEDVEAAYSVQTILVLNMW